MPGGSGRQRQQHDGSQQADPRFDILKWDPRFQRFPKTHKKLEIDERFQGMFTEPAFQQASATDKRGRRAGQKGGSKEGMRKYYRLKDKGEKGSLITPAAGAVSRKRKAEAMAHGPAAKVEGDSSNAEPASAGELSEGGRAAEQWARVRGLTGPLESSSDESESDAEEQEEEEGDVLADWGVGAMAANPDEAIPEGQETRRLAVLDLDWSHVRAVDILAVLRSFLSVGQAIERVTVFPSDYGLQRMAEEAAMGPQGLFDKAVQPKPSAPALDAISGSEGSSGQASDGGSSSGESLDMGSADGGLQAEIAELERQLAEEGGGASDSELEVAEQTQASEAAAVAAEDDAEAALASRSAIEPEPSRVARDAPSDSSESGDEVSRRRLQLYERARLRYFYAVVECSDAAAASRLYSECDGMEFLRSACRLDLRFVPDVQSFAERQQRDSATEVPPGYQPPDFATTALQHTNVKLTWDADDDARRKALHRRLTAEQIRDDDFKAYLGSESSDAGSGEVGAEPAALREHYRQMLLSSREGEGASAARTGRAKGKMWGTGDAGQDDGLAGESDDQAFQDTLAWWRRPLQAEQPRWRSAVGGTDMEVTFTPGLEGLGARLLAQSRDRRARRDETVWQAYLRRQKEKRQLAKARGRKAGSDDDESDSDQGLSAGDKPDAGAMTGTVAAQGEAGFDDPFFQDVPQMPVDASADEADAAASSARPAAAAKHKKLDASKALARQQREAEARRTAELELLLMDERELQGGTLAAAAQRSTGADAAAAAQRPRPGSKALRRERLQQKRAAKRTERQAGSDDDDLAGHGFALDTTDARFQPMFTSPDFALDPTDPRYKQLEATGATQRVAAERRKREQQPQAQKGAAPAAPRTPTARQSNGNTDSMQLKATVAQLKRKSLAARKRK